MLPKAMLMTGLFALLAASSNADSLDQDPTTFGPFPDFKGFKSVSVPVTIKSFLGVNLKIPFDGSVSIGIPDSRTFNVKVPVPVFTSTYVTISTSAAAPFNPLTGSATLTDIYGVDLNPAGTAISVTGFDATNPQIVPMGPETFTGDSGTVYTASVNTTSSLANLNSLLPGFDLSSFSGDPASVLYISQTTIPARDSLVPEPASALLLSACCLLMCVGRFWRLRAGRHR